MQQEIKFEIIPISNGYVVNETLHKDGLSTYTTEPGHLRNQFIEALNDFFQNQGIIENLKITITYDKARD